MISKNTNAKQNKKIKSIQQKLDAIPCKKHAKESCFQIRKVQKIDGKTLLQAFFFMAFKGSNSFLLWAVNVNNITGKRVSKQAVWKRITPCFTKFLQAILTDAFKQQVGYVHGKITKGIVKLNDYNRILIQDSTVIALPDWLNWCFPGSTSNGQRKAQLKIQVIFDLISNTFVYFEITPYTANDQSKAEEITAIAKDGDLVIRDLGYFTLESFKKMNQKDIKYVSRLKNNVKIYDITTGKEINLIAVLRKEGEFDDWVILGSKDKVAVRLVVQKLSEEQANLRRFKAKKDRDKRLNHSKDYYELLCYSLYITTVDQKDMSATEVTKVYGLRWRIENIFKCWKSQFHIQKLIPKGCSLTKERVEAIIYMMLIFILLLQVTIYNYMIKQNKNKDDCIISVAKLCNYIANNIDLFFENSLKKLFPNIQYYCSYDNRKDRLNYVQKFING
jgi:hypothetical protein